MRQSIVDAAVEWALAAGRNSVRPAINATGVILHTGLGRARLAAEAVRSICEAAEHHALVEFDALSGARGDRQDHVRDLLCELTGAPDALVVNNCASAVLLGLAALAGGREVLLSRGQMVEIGGSFRMPDIVRQSGAQLCEIGCTNKTHLSDYAEAITDQTAMILRCHPSNYRITGFTDEPPLSELAGIAREHKLWLMDDVGSGCLVDTTRFGLPAEPRFGVAISEGAHITMASGDKMLGGPQAGLILGTPEAIAELKGHPIARAVRVDKLTLAGLAATLRLYREGRESEIPTIWALSRPMDEIRAIAERWAGVFAGARVEDGLTETGGGSLPGHGVPTVRTGLPSDSADALAFQLRHSEIPIVGRIERGLVWLDPRTADRSEADFVEQRLKELSS